MTDIDPLKQSGLLRIVACGSADGGVSTLVDLLLSKSKLLYPSLAGAAQRDAADPDGRNEREFDLGRPAAIEIAALDVPWRFFAIADRNFGIVDTPGGEQGISNVAAAAATAEIALILIDARKGVRLQTKRHSRIASMFGIRHVLVAINKMDLVGWDEERYHSIEKDYRSFAEGLGFARMEFVPISALNGDNIGVAGDNIDAAGENIAAAGDNIAAAGDNSPWYDGPPLMQLLSKVEIPRGPRQSFRMPVQSVDQPNRGSRGFNGLSGRIAAGVLRTGDRVRIVPSGTVTTVKRISTSAGDVADARAGQCVSLGLADEVQVDRGDVVTAWTDPVEAADQFEARLVWVSAQPLIPERLHRARIHTQEAAATVTRIKHRIDIDSGQHLAASSLESNDIADVNLSFDRPVAFEPYSVNRTLGTFVLEDRLTEKVLAIGTLHFALRRAANVHWQEINISPQARAEIKHQIPRCFWLTGLPSSGKSTIANLMELRLHAAGKHTTLLDGDNVRHGLNRDLGFTEVDRVENIRRVAEVARLMVDSGLIVIVALISPFKAEREFARSLFKEGRFVEVFVDTSLATCEERDPKGLYAKARSGALKNFTGYDSPYEAPEKPEVWLRTAECSAIEAAERLAGIALMDR